MAIVAAWALSAPAHGVPLTGPLPAAWPQVDTLAPFFDGVDNPLLQRHLGAALAAGLGGEGDLAREAGKNFAAAAVGDGFQALNFGPLVMAGHVGEVASSG